jgi:hypothetical protein
MGDLADLLISGETETIKYACILHSPTGCAGLPGTPYLLPGTPSPVPVQSQSSPSSVPVHSQFSPWESQGSELGVPGTG